MSVFEQKIIQIADIIHGTIQVSELEKQIISTQAFNRLHNVLQNSTVYLTYPSNQTKRFAHSLGVMHIGSEMFYFCLVNADGEIRNSFFDRLDTEMQEILRQDHFQRSVRDYLGTSANIISSYKEIECDDPLYKSRTPHMLKTDQCFHYHVLLQSIRCAALLHDVGHPPFSHITEFAVQEVIGHINNKSPSERTEREKQFLEENQEFNHKEALHEQIGVAITNRLLESVVRTAREQTEMNNNTAEKIFFYLAVHEVTQKILKDATPFFADIHRIIDGTIDCDRLDYVTRDIENSGFTQGRIEYDRLISSMKLMQDDGQRYLFCTDIRTLSTVEDFFQRRWFLYKYVIFHHRVIKTDYLLGKAVVQLSLDYLSKEGSFLQREEQNHALPLDLVSGIRIALRNTPSDDQYFNSLIQWDDSWLLTVLRQSYYSTYKDSQETVKDQLEELLSNKKVYHSLIKRSSDFLEIDSATLKHLSLDWDNVLRNTEDKTKHQIGRLVAQVHEYEIRHTPHSNYGFFLQHIYRLFVLIKKERKLENAIEESIITFSKEYGFKDCIVVFKKLKTGLEKTPLMHGNNTVVKLSEVSRINIELRQNQTLFPTFFIYGSGKDTYDVHQFREGVGKVIATCVSEIIEKEVPRRKVN